MSIGATQDSLELRMHFYSMASQKNRVEPTLKNFALE